jgi:hypothetical protein
MTVAQINSYDGNVSVIHDVGLGVDVLIVIVAQVFLE